MHRGIAMDNRYHCIAEYVDNRATNEPFNDRFIRMEVIASNADEARERFEAAVNALRGGSLGRPVRYWKPFKRFIYPVELETICKDMEGNPALAEEYLAE
jgi:hypothetical protein